jgi:putative addiction module component (TIGR02574 family)
VNARTRKVLAEALELSPEDRALVAAELEASLEGEASPEQAEAIEKAWADEIERRARDVDEGRVKTIPAAEVYRELRDRLRAGR